MSAEDTRDENINIFKFKFETRVYRLSRFNVVVLKVNEATLMVLRGLIRKRVSWCAAGSEVLLLENG